MMDQMSNYSNLKLESMVKPTHLRNQLNAEQKQFELNKPEYNLTNGDIAGSKPCVNSFKSKRSESPSNPLNPQYNL